MDPSSAILDVVGQLAAVSSSLTDPPTAGGNLSSAVDAARTFAVVPGNPGTPAPNLALQPPSTSVPLPADGSGQAPGGLTDPGLIAVAPPIAPPGPAGPPGDIGPAGPPGPRGTEIDPARITALEQTVQALEDLVLTGSISALFAG